MADEVSNGHVKRPKDHLQVVTPLNILLIDCDELKIKDIFDENRFTVYFRDLEENYVSYRLHRINFILVKMIL